MDRAVMYSTKHNKLQECVCVNRVELVFEVVFEGCEACDGVGLMWD